MIRKIASGLLRIFSLRHSSPQERHFSMARRWSNLELRKFGPLFSGSAINVSAWEDRDKEGGFYKSYFPGCSTYHISNFGTSQGALQGASNEFFIDLTKELPAELVSAFDVVFNHTTLEHVYDFRKAFEGICRLSKDIVILVVPWLQPMHADYGDYWRFSQQALIRLFEDNKMNVLYVSWNETPRSSVYIFVIASHQPARWRGAFPDRAVMDPACSEFTKLPNNFPGKNAL